VDGKQFDDLSKALAEAMSRRGVLRRMVTGVAGGLLGVAAVTQVEARTRRGPGISCRENADCVAGAKCLKGDRGRRVCTCVGGTEACRGQCVDPDTAYEEDAKNCGSCGHRCRGGGICVEGECCGDEGGTCAANADCCGGICTCGTAEAGHCQTPFFQGFEANTNGWSGVTRVGSGTDGIASNGGSFHGKAATGNFTRWGGYTNVFPTGGYTTSVDIYLDMATSAANDTRFDWSSAVNGTGCNHRRDFVFNAGFYNDSDATGSGPRFVISASNNAGRLGANPKNPDRDPFAVADTGWYTFQHTFSNVGGVLSVQLTLSGPGGSRSWTLSDPTDVIGTTVGGNRYGGFVPSEFPFLAIDNSTRS
jgi:hypothetical protein